MSFRRAGLLPSRLREERAALGRMYARGSPSKGGNARDSACPAVAPIERPFPAEINGTANYFLAQAAKDFIAVGSRAASRRIEVRPPARAREKFLASDVGFGKLKSGTQRNYRRWLDTIKAEVGQFQIDNLTPVAVRAMRDSIKVKSASTTADACVMVISVLWKFSIEFCHLPLGHNPAHGVARVHADKKSHEPWPDHVVDKALIASDPILRLALHLLLYTGQREGDVVKMRWDDIRADEIFVVQEKTGTKVWIPLHRDLKALLDHTSRVGEFILNSSWGKPLASSQSLYEKIKGMLRRIGEGDYVPHGLRATAAVRLIEAGCSEDQAAAITGHRDLDVLRNYLRGVNQAKLARQAIRK